VYAFLEFELHQQELRGPRGGVDLNATPLRVLYFMAGRYGSVASWEELRTAVWGADTFVGDSAVRKAVDRANAAVRGAGGPPRVIELIPRRGFKFLPPVVVKPQPVFDGDRSRFIRDVTIPDGSPVFVNEEFVKSWEIQNIGSVPWEGRFLTRQGPPDHRRRLITPARVPIPTTLPGQSCIVSTPVKAPSTPGSRDAHWKMTDADGRLLLPNQGEVFISVDVVERTGSTGKS
jgi:DNA-binding winged helix-turn-helix (wHTH) protein